MNTDTWIFLGAVGVLVLYLLDVPARVGAYRADRRRRRERAELAALTMDMIRVNSDFIVMPDGNTLRTHPADRCAGEFCSVHNPSPHHMVDWPLNWRPDRRIMERICPCHGTGHPDPDDWAYRYSIGRATPSEDLHGCAGCCGVVLVAPDGLTAQ